MRTLSWILLGGWVTVGLLMAALQYRAGQLRTRYSDGCAKPMVEKPFRTDGSRKNILPRRGDGQLDDLEHLLKDHDSPM